jgi:hypothetical protein
MTVDRSPPRSLSPLETAVWRTIAYSDVFDYPLRLSEIHHFLEGVPADLAEVERVLANGRLRPRHLSYRAPYYMLPGRETIGQIRQRREAFLRRCGRRRCVTAVSSPPCPLCGWWPLPARWPSTTSMSAWGPTLIT